MEMAEKGRVLPVNNSNHGAGRYSIQIRHSKSLLPPKFKNYMWNHDRVPDEDDNFVVEAIHMF